MIKRIRAVTEDDILVIYGVYATDTVTAPLVMGAMGTEVMGVGQLRAAYKDKIVYTGSHLTLDVVVKGGVMGVKGFLAGSIQSNDFEHVTVPVCLTEGFGEAVVGWDLVEILTERDGSVVRITKPKTEEGAKLKKGMEVRVVGDPGPIGLQGTVSDKPEEIKVVGGYTVEAVEIASDDQSLIVPIANLEMIVTSE